MRALLRDLLNLALSGDVGREQWISLEEPLAWALSNLGPAVDESGATLERGALPEAMCEPSQIARVFQNLISNALKFRRPVPLRISVRAEITPSEVIVHVEDNGRGIDPAHQTAIFDPFQRAHGEDVPGSGLGLALCRKIVERHGGRIWVRSRPGEGTRLSFSLPARDELPAPR
jgi:signal transduction histidine kinase